MISRLTARFPLKQYLLAVLSVAAALLCTIAARPVFQGKAPLFFFTIAVLLSAASGGLRTGLFSTALTLAVLLSLFRNDMFIFVLAQSSLLFFTVIGIAISLVVDKLHRTNAALARARDELAAANEKLAQRTETLSHSNEELQRFAYSLAHDLHNPLRSVGALTDLLLHRNAAKLDESSRECARLIVQGVERMESLINGLLEYAAAAGDPDNSTAIDCNGVIERVLQDLRHLIDSTGAGVTFDRLPDVRVNEGHLVQVFSNLIGNGIKYRSARKPHIHISAMEQAGDWLFAVRDNGIGLEMKHAETIFGMFKRLHASERYEGSGIGLALCKVVIQRYGGRIWVESAPGEGSTFLFTLPRCATEPAVRKRIAAGR